MVADCEGISADDGGGDRGKVVRVEGLGRGAAECIPGGVTPPCVVLASVLRRRITGG